MNTLLICDKNANIGKINRILTQILENDTGPIYIIKNTSNWKQLFSLSEQIGIATYVKEANNANIYRLAETIAKHCDKVLVISNGGNVTKKLAYISNLTIIPDRRTTLAVYNETCFDKQPTAPQVSKKWKPFNLNIDISMLTDWRLTEMEHIDLDESGNYPITTTDMIDDITKYVMNTPIDKLVRSINGKYFTSAGIMKIGGLLGFYSALRMRGIYAQITEDMDNEPPISELCTSLGIHPLKSFILDAALNKEYIFRLPGIIKPDVKELAGLINNGNVIRDAISLIDKHLNNRIALVTDSDADGLTSATTGYLYFKRYLNKEIDVIINERRHGNGVNDTLIDRILDMENVRLVITADHGSSDDDRFKKLKDNGIDVLVTDHHTLPDTGIPKNANVFLNCMHYSSGLPEYISGCTVLYSLLYNHHLSRGNTSIMEDLILYAGISVISDMMPLNNGLNRFLYNAAVDVISNTSIPWKEAMGISYMTYNDMSMTVISLINAGNRMGKAYLGFKLLSSDNTHSAEYYYKELKKLNKKKKALVRSGVKEMDIKESEKLIVGISDTTYDGLLGLLAGKLDHIANNKCYMAVSKIKGYYKGSLRCNATNINLAKTLQGMNDMLLRSGGHKNAAGISFRKEDLEKVITELDKRLPVLDYRKNGGIEIPIRILMSPGFHSILRELMPYGVGFKQPNFVLNGIVKGIKNSGITHIYIESDGIKIPVKSFKKLNYSIGDHIEVPIEIKLYGNDKVEYWI